MPFTANCDLYGAVHEGGVNRIIQHIMRQRPSLFNYASGYIAQHPDAACASVRHTSDVAQYNNPDFKVENPIPVLGADAPPFGLNYAAQILSAQVDFFPGNVLGLPAELNPPMADQRFALKVRVCGGLDCPSIEYVKEVPPGGSRSKDVTGAATEPSTPIVPPTRKLNCFCLDAYVLGHIETQFSGGQNWLIGVVDDVDIVDIQPDQLEAAINCYLRFAFNVLLREKLAISLDKMFLGLNKDLENKLVKVTLSLTPNPPAPHNPVIEDNQVKAFLDLKVSP